MPNDLYDQRIDDMKARERVSKAYAAAVHLSDRTQESRNAERLAAYMRNRAMFEIQRLGQEMENG